MRRVYLRNMLVIAAALAVGFGISGAAYACIPNQQSCSGGYGVSETYFGTGGSLCDPSSPSTSEHSTNYCAKTAIGETGVGNASSSTYQAQAGFNTDRLPSLTVVVNTSSIDFGVLTPGTTSTATATFLVKSYLANNYVVTTAGAPPTNGVHTIAVPASPANSNTASEQFGINLVANNSCGGGMPASLGAVPSQAPDSTFSFGAAAHNNASDYYDTACKFMYANQDTIATSAKSSGETDFTISYIFNITNVTPGGRYTMGQSIVATSTF